MFIDVHTHCIRFNDPRQAAINEWATDVDLITQLDRLGIEQAVLLPLSHHEIGTMLQSTESALDIAALYPDRLIPFCNLDPRRHYNNAKVDHRPTLRHYQDLGCKGLGEFTCNLPWDDDRVMNLLSQCEEVGMPVLFHVASADRGMYGLVDEVGLPKLEKVVKMFPKLNFIGHSMAFWSAISGDANESNWMGYPEGPVTPGGKLPELLRNYDNVWGDISAGSGNNALVRDKAFGFRFLEEFQDRLLFGTDICRGDQDVPQVDTMNEALASGVLSQEGFEKINHLNAKKLLGL
jgi:uncharacterized protein